MGSAPIEDAQKTHTLLITTGLSEAFVSLGSVLFIIEKEKRKSNSELNQRVKKLKREENCN